MSLELENEAHELLKRSPFAFDVQLNNQLVEMHANAELDALCLIECVKET